MQYATSITLNPIHHVEGTINLPGSKSLSNRALLLAALAHGTTNVTNLLDSDDIRHMLNALKHLGVQYSLSDDKSICEVQGLGGAFQWHDGLALFLGNAGTAMRPLAAALCLAREGASAQNEVILTGEPRMKERPIQHLVDALLQAGADIRYLENEGFPPIADVACPNHRAGRLAGPCCVGLPWRAYVALGGAKYSPRPLCRC